MIAQVRAAQRLRDRADEMTEEIESGHYYWQAQTFGVGVRGALGGSAGELGAMLAPGVAQALADLLTLNTSMIAPSSLDAALERVAKAILTADADR